MEKLVYNILKLEKLRGETYEMKFEENEIYDVLHELQTEFSALFPGRKITVSSGACFRFDRTWLKEAIGNLIKNLRAYDGGMGFGMMWYVSDKKQRKEDDLRL